MPDREQARAYFEQSLGIEAHQQRALYNLGLLAFTSDPKNQKKVEEARDRWLKATRLENWEQSPNANFPGHIYYCLACAFSRLAEHETGAQEKGGLLDSAMEWLMKAAEKGSTPESIVRKDLEAKGEEDLGELARSTVYANRIDKAMKMFREAWKKRTESH